MIRQFAAGSCYSYIISSGKEAIVVDPHISLFDSYTAHLKKYNLGIKYIVDTHTHADHFSLAAVLKKEYLAPVLMHEKAVSSFAENRLKDGDEVKVGSLSFKVIYAPGHTDDTINLQGEGALFTGDVLLIGSVGRADFQNGSPESMFDTLQKIKALPGNTIVYPAHDYNGVRSSTIAKEKGSNPFLKEADKGAFVKNLRSKVLAKPFNMDNIVRVNRTGEATRLAMISPKDAQELLAKDARYKLIDVRSPLEFTEVHIKGAANIPMDMVASKLDELGKTAEACIVLCRTGTRSAMAADMLLQSGIKDVKVLDGGMTHWQKERFPVEKGVGGISIERQVRIGAGTLILTGIVLAALVHPAFIGISVFVSCGLIYAGLTDNCMMGMLLMKLPYNKKLYKTKSGGGTCAAGAAAAV
jgi:glyoxylase-like metal-dependent hydrolase (beta-lactamase superfamily II)